MIKIITSSLLLASSLTYAQTPSILPDIVKLQGPYTISMELVQKSDVHLYIPDGGVATISLEGNDVFDTATDNTNQLISEIHKSGKTVLVKSEANGGASYSMGLVTKCGKAISITIHGLSNQTKPKTVKPKLFITSANCTAS